jgi:hypothetical protein
VPLKFGGGLLRETFTIVRECGRGRDECVAYWAGPVGEPDLLDRVIHPEHVGSRGFYEIAPDWLNKIWFDLNENQIEIRLQVHTHRGRAFHSKLDDDYPFMQTAGFLSLVLPKFGLGPVGLDDAYLTELMPGGGWREVSPASAGLKEV